MGIEPNLIGDNNIVHNKNIARTIYSVLKFSILSALPVVVEK